MIITVTNWEKAGFFNEKVNVELAISRIGHNLEYVPGLYQAFSAGQLVYRPGEGKWSRKEILGHLVDSAINNLKRFTEIQYLSQPYQLVTYRQDELVIVNHYQDVPLGHLLDLWKALNQQISHVVRYTPAERLDYSVITGTENDEKKSLGWLICDYVAHLEHHLRQVTEME